MQYSYSIVFALVLSIAGAATLGDETRKAFQEHNKMVRNFVCRGDPHPRVFQLKELEGDDNQKKMESICKDLKMINPPVTVLHRCHDAPWCCGKRDRWIAEKTEVNLTFSCLSSGKMQYFDIKEQNQTNCFCG